MTLSTTSRTIRDSAIAGVAINATPRAVQDSLQRAGVVARSLKTKLLLLALVFAAVPIILYSQFQEAYSDNQRLIEQSVQEQGRLIMRAIEPLLVADGESLPTLGQFSDALEQIADGEILVRVLFRPVAASTGADAFYFVAATPLVSRALLAEVREELLSQGVLDLLAPTCDGGIDEAIRYRTSDGNEEILTSITPHNNSAGCWVILTSHSTFEYQQSPLGVPYWMRPEARSAAIIYAVMAVITLSLFAGIWRSLRRFGRLAQRIGATQDVAPSFAAMNRIPELAGVASEFDRMVEALQNSARTIRRAAEDNTHAFKTPIAVIRHCLEPLERAIPDLDDRGRVAVERIHKALDRLDGLVSFARRINETEAELINPPRTRLNLSTLVEGLLTSYTELVNQREISLQLELDDDVHVRAGEDMLETVLENLIENAFSFTPRHGRISVSLRQTDDTVKLSISDSGPGVPEPELEQIFKRYYSRRDSADTVVGKPEDHLGIGLWIVRSHIEAVGGQVYATRAREGGLQIIIHLPVHTPQKP